MPTTTESRSQRPGLRPQGVVFVIRGLPDLAIWQSLLRWSIPRFELSHRDGSGAS